MSRDTNFYYSFLVLPPAKRRAIIAVWDFCRAVDDAVDAAPGDLSDQHLDRELNRWREELARCFDDREPATAEGRRLKPFVGRFNLPRQPFEDLIDGVGMDVSPRRYETFEELHDYCLHVASTVGLICIEIFGYRNEQARDYAVALGVALQLTNIIRDVPTDFGRGRVYLPTEDLRRFGCEDSELGTGGSKPVRELLAFECERARRFYAKAAETLPAEDGYRLVAAEIMGAIYMAILHRIEIRAYDVFTEVVRVPRPRRALIAAWIWLRALLRRLPGVRAA